jgi:26S proteasome regulatory subunit T1
MSAKDEKKQIDTTDKKDDAKDKKTDVQKDDKGNPLSESDIKLFQRYCKGPYTEPLKKVEEEIKSLNQKIVNLQGIKESDTGLSLPT